MDNAERHRSDPRVRHREESLGMYWLSQGEQDHLHPCPLAQVPPRVLRDVNHRCLQWHRGTQKRAEYERQTLRSEHQARFRADPETVPRLVG